MNHSINGLRAVAIIMVMLVHSGAPLFSAGWLGVDLFFVLSGFLISTLMLDEYQKSGSVSLRMFWARRFLRLMPIYMLYIGGISLAMYFGPRSDLSSHGGWSPFEYVLSLWTYLGNLPPLGGIWKFQQLTIHLWSLSVEEQFYFLWPLLLISLLKTRWLEPAIWALVMLTLANNLVTFSGMPPPNLLHVRGIGIFIGCATAITLHRHSMALERLRFLSSGAAAAALCAMAFSFASVTYYSEIYHLEVRALIPLGVPVFAFSVAFLIANLWKRQHGSVGDWLSTWPLPQIGKISYGAYLYHMLVHQLVWVVLLNGIQSWPKVLKFGVRLTVFMVLTFAISALSYWLIESPFLKLKDRFRGSQRLFASK